MVTRSRGERPFIRVKFPRRVLPGKGFDTALGSCRPDTAGLTMPLADRAVEHPNRPRPRASPALAVRPDLFGVKDNGIVEPGAQLPNRLAVDRGPGRRADDIAGL